MCCALLALLNTNSDLQICTLRNVCKWMSLLWSRASLCVSPATQTTFSKHQQKVQVIWRLCAAQFFSLCALVLLNLGLKTKTKMIHFPVATNTSQRWVKCKAKSCCHGFRIIFYLKITDSQKFKWFFVCFSQDFVQKQSVQLNRADADYQQTIMFSSWELWLVCVVGDNYFRLNICIPPILNTIEDWNFFQAGLTSALHYCIVVRNVHFCWDLCVFLPGHGSHCSMLHISQLPRLLLTFLCEISQLCTTHSHPIISIGYNSQQWNIFSLCALACKYVTTSSNQCELLDVISTGLWGILLLSCHCSRRRLSKCWLNSSFGAS